MKTLPRNFLHRLFWLMLVACTLASLGAAAAAAEFLEPERAFVVSVRALDERAAEVRIVVAPGYYLYREAFRFEATAATLDAPEIPPGKVKFDQTFQKNLETHRDDVRIRVPVREAGPEFLLAITSQGCADAGLCYPPQTLNANVSLAGFGGNASARMLAVAGPGGAAGSALLGGAAPAPSTGSDESASVVNVLRSGRLWAIVGAFALMGLLLAFTPCVLPMVPILSSIIVGHGNTVSRGRGLGLAAVYSLGMGLVYTALGVAAGLAGEGLAAALQTPWVLGAFALVMVLLALAMFDVFQLRLPAALERRLTDMSHGHGGGRLAGVFMMGALSALIVSPCVSAPLAGALLFISQTRDVVLGGAALLALSFGMSVPLLLVGASAGALLPKGGPWMLGIKKVFGVVLLGVAVWIIQPVLPSSLALWGPPAQAPAVTFKTIRNVAELDAELRATARPVLLDFYADWCVSCKEMERFTFTDTKVAALMSQALLLKADVTANNDDDRALLKRFHLFGPPGTIFFDAQGRELTGVRAIGYQDAAKFTQTLKAAGLGDGLAVSNGKH